MRLLSSTALALLLTGCVLGTPQTTSLRVAGAAADASVTVDDRYLGVFGYVQAHGVAMPPGKHRITVEKTGFFPWDKVLVVHEGDPPVQLEVALVQIPD
jgi:hypothetical protein